MGYAGIKVVQKAIKDKAKALKPPIVKENVIQKNVAKYLDGMSNDGENFFWKHTPNNVYIKNKFIARLWKLCGVKAGVPDCEILFKGKTYYIELKTETGSISNSQKKLFPKLIKHGATIAVCKSVFEVSNQLKEWKII